MTQDTKVDWGADRTDTETTKGDRHIMRAWLGGKKPPTDWDGKAVIFRNGATARSTPGIIWKLGWDHSYGQTDIIAYSVAELPAVPTPTNEVRERMEAGDEYQQTIDMLRVAADLGQSVTLTPQGARTAASAMIVAKQPPSYADEVGESMEALAREVAAFSGHDITFSERPGHSVNISVKCRAIVALLDPVDGDEAYATKLLKEGGWANEPVIGTAAVAVMIAQAHREGRALAEAGK